MVQKENAALEEPHELARPAGFEPTTPWFVAKYSIQLSYGRFELIKLNCVNCCEIISDWQATKSKELEAGKGLRANLDGHDVILFL